MTKAELDEIKNRMEAEHRLDMQALARIMRFLPLNGAVAAPEQSHPSLALLDPNAKLLAGDDRSIVGSIRTIFQRSPNRTWTVPQIKDQLLADGVSLTAKSPAATISVAVKKLHDRNEVTLVRSGSGRQPHIYQLKRPPDLSDCEVLEEGEDEITN